MMRKIIGYGFFIAAVIFVFMDVNEGMEADAVTIDSNTEITSDPETWPTGDRIWDICRAIAMAEGANIPNSNPDRLNNPGDISDGGAVFAYMVPEEHSGSVITHFPDKATGWQWLYTKVKRHLDGNSSTYPASLTITEFAQKYAGNWQNWKANVGNALSVDPDSVSFSDYVNS